jgi:1-acyl-sn-glycerol-3-phosphate acyltransferase
MIMHSPNGDCNTDIVAKAVDIVHLYYNNDNMMMIIMVIIIILKRDQRKKSRRFYNTKSLPIEIHDMWNVKTEVVPVNNRNSWNHIKIRQKIPEQHTEKARHKGAAEKSLTGHCARTAGSADVEVQNIQCA